MFFIKKGPQRRRPSWRYHYQLQTGSEQYPCEKILVQSRQKRSKNKVYTCSFVTDFGHSW